MNWSTQMKNSRIAKENIDYEKKMNEYYLKCFLLEFSKICIFFIFFSLLGLIPEYLIALLSLMLLRSNGGGLHYKHYISCLSVSFLFLCGSITLATYITPPTILACFTSLLCSLIGYWLVPITGLPKTVGLSFRMYKRSDNHHPCPSRSLSSYI